VTVQENQSETQSKPVRPIPMRRGPDEYGLFRRLVRIGAAILLVVNLGVGLFARQQQHAIIDYAINIYDTAFVSINYIHRAQLAFQHYADSRLTAGQAEAANSALEDVLENLEVAIERADSPRTREMTAELKNGIAALAGHRLDAAELQARLSDIQEQMERLGSRASGVGLKARDNIEASSSRSNMLLWISTAMSAVMVLVALLILERLISQGQATRRDAERRDLESAAAAEQQSLARERELAAKALQNGRMTEVLDRFARQMMEPTAKLHHAAKDLNVHAETLRETAQQAKTQSITVAAASEQTATIVQSAASTGEQLAQTIGEVEAHANESRQLAAGAVKEVEQTNSTFNELAIVAKEISDVTDLIGRIAAQTNLLALNATIEAARAGEAGRGFAVVAQEVKTLSGQSAAATQDISKRIAAIQNVTGRAVEAIGAISLRIRDLENFSVRIAAAVEQQTKAAVDIAGDLSSASANVTNVNEAIGKVESVGNRTAVAAELLSAASNSVTDQARNIHEQVRSFTEHVRAIQAG